MININIPSLLLYYNIWNTKIKRLTPSFSIRKAEGVKNCTINKMLGTIKAMLNYLVKENLITESHITMKKLKYKEAKLIIPTPEEILRFKKYMDNQAPLEYRVMFHLNIE